MLLSSAGVVDGVFVGQYVGPLALASINIIWPVFGVLNGIAIALASGGAVRCAAYLGRGEGLAAKAVYTKTMLSGIVFSIILSLFSYMYPEEIVTLLGADATLLPFCVEYLTTVSFFFPPFVVGFIWAYFLRVDEFPTLASLGLACTAVVNVILDYIFIVHLSLGIMGSALATGLAYSSAIALYVYGYLWTKKTKRLYFTKSLGSWLEVFQSIWNGISEMINEMSSGLVLIIINITVIQLIGPYGVAAFSVISYVHWFCLMLCYGFSDSLSPLVSANHACNLHRRSRSLFLCGVGTALGIGVICYAVVSIFPQELIAFFIKDDEKTINYALNFMDIFRYVFLLCGINIMITAFFTGLLKAGASAIVSVLRTLIFPIFFIWLFPKFMQYLGVAYALAVGELITLVIALFLLYKLYPKDNRRIKTT